MKRNNLRWLSLVAAVGIAVAACDSTPDYVIPPKKMAQLMADVHVGEAVIESNSREYGNDSLKKVMKQSIYMKHGVTSEQVDTSMYWYGHNIDKYMEVYDNTIKILEKRISDAERLGVKAKLAVSFSADGDSVNLWQGVKNRRFTTDMASDFITFHHTTDRNWDRGDRFRLNAKMIDTRSPMTMNMAVEYNDGTTEYTSATFSGDGMRHLDLVLDSAKSALSVYGSLRYHPVDDEVAYLDSISLVRTHNKDNNKQQRAEVPVTLIRHR